MSNQVQHAGTVDAGAHGENHAQHNPYLQHHFDTMEQQFDSAKQGMWLFLATEILFFSGLFCAYAVYRANHPEVFIYAHQYLDKILGGINTVVLIFSSFTMAWAVRCAQLNHRKGLIINLIITILCAFGFLGIKYVEYKHKWEDGLLWGTHFNPQKHGHGAYGADVFGEREEGGPAEHSVHEADPYRTPASDALPDDERTGLELAAPGPAGLAAPQERDAHDYGEQPSKLHIFFGIYFAMTGLHAIHVIVGIGLLGWILIRAVNGEFGSGYFTPVDLVGLYWHIVDLIWIFLFPLLYLIH